jgi:hypothetical protein
MVVLKNDELKKELLQPIIREKLISNGCADLPKNLITNYMDDIRPGIGSAACEMISTDERTDYGCA